MPLLRQYQELFKTESMALDISMNALERQKATEQGDALRMKIGERQIPLQPKVLGEDLAQELIQLYADVKYYS